MLFGCCYSAAAAGSVDEEAAAEVVFGDSPLSRRRQSREADGDLAESTPRSKVPEAPLEVVKTAPEEREEEESDDGTFNVTLEMTPGERLGALLDVLDMKTLRIVEVRPDGRLRRHNMTAPEKKQVKPGYFIICVNGKSGKVEEMVKELRRSRTWRLRVARKQEFTVSIEKTGNLCLDLQFEPESDCIVIRRIGDGVVKAYNQTVPEDSADHQIKAGDRILGVNDTQAPAKTLLETIRGNRDLTMKIGRPCV